MIVAHDFGYYLGMAIGLVIFVGIPLLVIAGLVDFWRRMLPVIGSIWGLFFHLHRHR